MQEVGGAMPHLLFWQVTVRLKSKMAPPNIEIAGSLVMEAPSWIRILLVVRPLFVLFVFIGAIHHLPAIMTIVDQCQRLADLIHYLGAQTTRHLCAARNLWARPPPDMSPGRTHA